MIEKNSISDTNFNWPVVKRRYGWEVFRFDTQGGASDGILDLVKSYYGEVDETHPEYFRWEYIDNPAGPAIIWLAVHRNNTVGQFIINLTKIKTNSVICKGGLIVKSLVRKDFWGKGISPHLAQRAKDSFFEQGGDFCYGIPNKNAYRQMIERLKWNDIGKIPLLVRPVQAKGPLRELINNRIILGISNAIVFPLLIIYGKIYNCFSRLYFADRNKFIIKKISYFDERFDRLWEKACNKHEILVVRDKAFLNWRYVDNPRRTYEIYSAEDAGGSLIAYIVLRVTFFQKLKVGYIVDSLFDEDGGGACALSALLDKSYEFFKKQETEIISCLMLPNNSCFGVLKKNGFFVCPDFLQPEACRFLITTSDQGALSQRIKNIKNWYLTLGDFDFV